MSPEVWLVLVGASIGSLVTLGLLWEAVQVRKAFVASGEQDETKSRLTVDEVVDEVFRLTICLAFLGVAIVIAVAERELVRQIAIWVLAVIPMMIAGWSVYALWRRRQLLNLR